jgi:hypothetical protein
MIHANMVGIEVDIVADIEVDTDKAGKVEWVVVQSEE